MARTSKAAIYCRVSTLHQIDKDSLPMQRQDMINYAKYALNINDYEIFEDAGYSGKNTDRPAFQDMMRRVQDGEFSHILVWKIDRISRNLLDFATMYARCKKLGVTFVSKNEQFDTSTAMGEAMLKIILVFAELERNMTSERVTATMIARANEKRWNGGRVPFGYKYDKNTQTFAIRDDEAAVVHRIYDTYSNLKSLQYIADALNADGLKTRRGYAWSAATCHIILTSPFYLGIMRYNYRDESEKTFSFKDKSEWVMIPNHHPPLVTQEQFDNCQYWLRKNSKLHGHQHVQKAHTHIFAGLIHCGYCGALMTASQGSTRVDGYTPSIYVCGSKRTNKKCVNKSTWDDEVGNIIFRYISNMIRLKDVFTPAMHEQRIEQILTNGITGIHVKDKRALSSLRNMLMIQSGHAHTYSSQQEQPHSKKLLHDKSVLTAEIQKLNRAQQRLEELYLFSDSQMSQKDYLLRSQQISSKIASCKEQLHRLQQNSIFVSTLSDEQLIFKATSFILQKSMREQQVDTRQLIAEVGRQELKDFVNYVIDNIISKDGKVTEITFKNGMTHTFDYDK